MDELSPAKRRLLEQWLHDKAASRNPRTIPQAAPDSDGTWPVSFQQEDLCLRQWIEPDFTGFNNPKAMRLRGPLQYQALKQGLAAVVARHAILRTVYRFNAGELRQFVMPMASPELPLQIIDSPDILQAERQSHCLALDFIRRPFDLSRESSLRAVLYQLAEHDHLLLIVVHHIASDLTSHQHLLNELARGYQDAINGSPPPEPLSIQYTDYAVWQRHSYANERLRLRRFWCKTLQGAPMLLHLAANALATPAKESKVILHRWHVTESQLQAIDALASRFRSSRFMVILSLVAHLLRQITQQEDLLLGVSVNHRSQPELEPLIGDLVDLLPLRLRFTEHVDDVGHGLQTTRNALLESLDHRNMPFAELVRELQPQRQEGRMPLIQTAVTYSENQIVHPDWPELKVEAIELARDHMALDMHWSFQAMGNDLACSLECATQRLGGNTMADLPDRFQDLVERVIRLASSPDGIRQPVLQRHPHDHDDNDVESSNQELVPLVLPNDAALLADSASTEDPISHGITLQPIVVGRFEAICREFNATLEMGLIALVAALLRRYCQQDAFTIGTVFEAPQPTDQTPSGCAGPLAVHTLVIPIRWRDGLSFRDLLQEVRLKRLTAADRVCHPSNTHHDDKPSQRDPTPNPPQQVLLGLDVNLGSLNQAGEGGRPELFFGFARLNAGLQVSVSYNPRRFLQAHIDRAANHLKILLDGMLADPVKPISKLPLLTAAEIQQLHSWSQGPELAVPQLCLHQLFERQVMCNPNAIALVLEGQSLTYGELNARANRMAHHLIGLGVRPDDRVAIAVERSLEMVVGLLAILKAGGAYVPLDPAYPQERLAFILEDSGPVVLLVHGATRDRLASLDGAVRTIDLDADATEWEALTSANPDSISIGLMTNHLAYVIYTSGSTGRPKGVMVEHRNAVNFIEWSCHEFPESILRRILFSTSISFDLSVFECFVALSAGCTSVIVRNVIESSSALAHVTLINTVPSAMKMLLRDGSLPANVQAVNLAGEPLGRELVEIIFQMTQIEQIRNLYGPSETTTYSTWVAMRRDEGFAAHIGRPIANTRIYLLDGDGHVVPIGVAGELYIGGAGVARGYLNRPELTAERFLPDPFAAEPDARMYRTGDLARWLPDGNLEYLGRLDFQVKIRGFRIELGEIEAALRSGDGIHDAVVLAREDLPDDKRLVAYVIADPKLSPADVAALPSRLTARLENSLPGFMVPAAFVRLAAFPLTPNGKLDRHALPAPTFSGDLERRIAPASTLEQQLHQLWSEVLGHADFGVTDNFFHVGGHSLAAARLIARIEQALGEAPSLPSLFQNPTIQALVPLLPVRSEEAAEATADSAIPVTEPLPGSWPEGCESFPASFAQSRLWFLQQYEPGLTAYHMPMVWRLRGSLDRAALQQALSGLIERHPTLRTSFQMLGDEVLQLLHPATPFSLSAEPLEGRDPDALIDTWLEQEATTPFDLSSGLLLRARLLRMAEHDHLLLLNHHHIASDGWSVSVLWRDLTALYNAYRHGHPPDLRPLTVHYHDYTAWQRQRLSGSRLRELQDHWIEVLAGLQPLDLPGDRPRPAAPSYRGGSVRFTITAGQLEPFEALCQGEGATLQMGLLALLAVLLHRYSQQDDFAIGVPIWGRNHPDLEPLIGLFVNTLPIRTRFSAELSFRQLLAQVKATSIAAYDHQELPFEQMVEALQPERDRSRNPLVQVMLQLIELRDSERHHLDGLDVELLDSSARSARLDLEIFLRRQHSGDLQATLSYATDLFEHDRIERLSSQLLTLLASAIATPDAAAVALKLLPPSERLQIESWQDGPRIDLQELCVHQLFERQVERSPDAIGLIFQDQRLSYAELNARASKLAQHLTDLGVGPEVIVAVCFERSIEMVVALLSILKAGGAYLSLDPSWPRERKERLLRQAGCRWLLLPCAREEQVGGWDGLILTVNATGEAELQQPATRPDAGNDGEDPSEAAHRAGPTPSGGHRLAYLTYTSGSTGVPKGVAIEHRSILRLVDPVNGFRLGAGAVVLQLAPLAFDAATLEIWGPLLGGGTLVLAPPGLPTLGELAELLRREGITTLWLTAGLFHALVEEEPEALAGVRQVLAGGDVLSPSHVMRLLNVFPTGHELINGYGPTENTTFTCCHRMAAGELVNPQKLPIGRPIALTKVHVLDPAGNPCPIGVPGELHIGGAGLARGYLNNPRLTADKFILDPFSADPAARLYRSGDLASWNPDGTVAFHGRLDQQIKLRGFRIEPGEIEANLIAHPGVAQAAVLLRQDDPANPRLIAYWIPHHPPGQQHQGASSDMVGRGTAPPTAAQLRSFLSQRLPDSMVPAAFIALEALPLTANGKLDHQALPEPSFSGNQEERIAPSTELERQLHGLWAEVLGHEAFGVRDNFFLVGGHSLSSARLTALIDQRLGLRLPLSVLFQHPTLRELSQWLVSADPSPSDPSSAVPSDTATNMAATRAAGSGYRSLVTLQPQGKVPALFVVHGGNGDVYIHLHLARCLAPHRPVHGLQAVGFDGSAPRHRSVAEMAAHYADEILRCQPSGPHHLLGYSGGGWYAWAVADELCRRGVTPGLIGLVDTGATADLHRRLRLRQLVLRQLRRLPKRARSLGNTDLSRWPAALNRKRKALRFIAWTLLFPRDTVAPQVLNPTAKPKPTQPVRGDYFIQLHTYYRPPRLPLRTDVFAANSQMKEHQKLWNFYTHGRAVLHPFLQEHTDYYNADLMPEFADLLESVLAEIEAG